MKRMWITGCLALALTGALSLTTGCDEEIGRKKEVKVEDGKVKEEETRVVKEPDGDIRVDKQTETRKSDSGKTETKTQVKTETFPNPK